MEQTSSKKWLWITLGIVAVLLVLGILFWFFGRNTTVGKTIGQVFPFGAPTQDNPQRGGSSGGGGGTMNDQGGVGATTIEPMFRQLTTVPVAGTYALKHGGMEYARYIEQATGHTYEVSLGDGTAQQLTNTTMPRIALADWVLGGNAVVMRSLERDTLSGSDVIKTRLGRLTLPSSPPVTTSSSSPQGNDQLGAMTISLFPDNIIALSVAPDGQDLFYLIKTADGVSGSIVNLNTKTTQEVFRNTFSEWSAQLLNDDIVILTTKPSGNVPGYSYYYDPKTKSLERLVRGKNGLTTLGNALDSRVLYGENVGGGATLGAYNKLGFSGDEGVLSHEKPIPLATLPEKCAWLQDGIRLICGAFVNTPSGLIPDLWYQGRLSFADTFWSVNTDTGAIAFLADPKAETHQEFDVENPMISPDGDYLIFTNKKDGTLWSFHIPQTAATIETLAPNTTPAGTQNATGTLPTASTTPKKPTK